MTTPAPAPLPQPIYRPAVAFGAGFIWILVVGVALLFVVGARFQHSVPDETVYVYDLASGRWDLVPNVSATFLRREPDGRVRAVDSTAHHQLWTPSSGAVERTSEPPLPSDERYPPGLSRSLVSAPTASGGEVVLWFMGDERDAAQTTIYRMDGRTPRRVAGPLDLTELPAAVAALDAVGDRLALVDGACGATLVAGGAVAPAPATPWRGDCHGLGVTVLASGEVFGIRGRDVALWSPVDGRGTVHGPAPREAAVRPSIVALDAGRVAVGGSGAIVSVTSSSAIVRFAIAVVVLLGALALAVLRLRRLATRWTALGVGAGALLAAIGYYIVLALTVG